MFDRLNTLFASVTARLYAEDGQAMAEYAHVLALVSVAAVVILGTLGTNIVTKITSVAGDLAP